MRLFITVLTASVFLILAVLAGMQNAMGAEPPIYRQRPRIIALNYNAIMPSRGDQRLNVVGGWYNPAWLNDTYISDMADGSHDIVKYRLVKTMDLDYFPIKYDGFRYTHGDMWTPGSYLYSWRVGMWHLPDGIDYRAVIRDFDLARRCDKGEVDEVFMQGAPSFGYWESHMVGKGAYWCNSSGLQKSANANKFIIMGFNYERGAECTVHDYGHRAESIMRYTYGSWNMWNPLHDWDFFTQNLSNSQGPIYGCGNDHFPPNAESGYDYINTEHVTSNAIDWLNNYPDLIGQTTLVNRDAWGMVGGDYHRGYFIWWYQHMPHMDGRNNNHGYDRLNNWWGYLQDLNRWPESGGDMIGSSQSLPQGTSPIRITNNDMEDLSPQINALGRVAWSGFDGSDFEIYSANADGADKLQVSSQDGLDENPKINSTGRIVWQRFHVGWYDIFTANADGTDLVQITNNAVDRKFDWHPEINDSGRIVWDRFDGEDYEIYSANSDGTDIVQITDNEAASGIPRDDCWAQINNSGRIVWMGHDGGDWEIYSANSDGTDLVQISNNSYDDEYPQINDSGRVVWHCFHWTTNAEIYSANSDGTGLTRITNNSREDWHPQISNSGKIVWMGHDGSDWEIYTANADGTGLTAVTSNTAQDIHPVIHDDRIVWQGLDKNDPPNDQNWDDDWEIYAYIDGTIYKITDNQIDDRAPAITAGGGMTWQGDAGVYNEADIYAIDPDTDSDGLPDNWEYRYFGDLSQGPDGDYDLDGLTNLQELTLGSEPNNTNTDEDGVDDGDEVKAGTDPTAFTYYVDDSHGDNSNDGILPRNSGGHGPKKTIQAGIDLAAAREEVAVNEGTYTGAGNRDLDLNGLPITVKATKGAARTIIDCENAGRGFYCYHIGGSGALIDGFTIQNGYTADKGGGIHCAEGTMTVKNCVVKNCSSVGNGGGIFSRLSTDVKIINCLVHDNSSSGQGGGIFAAKTGITVINSTVEGNHADIMGGGIACDNNAVASVTDCIIRGNTAPLGNQISLKSTAHPSTIIVEYCNVEKMQAGCYVTSGCTLDWGDGNISANPIFSNGPLGDYYLSQTAAGQASDSPCVDAGSDTAEELGFDTSTTRTDSVGDTATIDMGYHYPLPWALSITSIETASDDVTIEWSAWPGVSYIVQWSTDMAGWTDVPVGETDTWTDYNAIESKKLYRVRE